MQYKIHYLNHESDSEWVVTSAEDVKEAKKNAIRKLGSGITIYMVENLDLETTVSYPDVYDVSNLYPEVIPNTHDPVKTPSHYTKGIETLDYINSWDMSFMEGNVIKYVTRYKYKNGVQDLEKALEYLTRLIKSEQLKETK